MSAYYNENDEEKAAWLAELIHNGIIAHGEVDTRSIAEVQPEELAGFAQCHFFAGIGVWSYALRLAGWPDDRPVWTGSCPCPSFSAAGKGTGFDDPRHLWPDWARLIHKCRPATLFGEQADDAIGYGWLDLVQTDLEREDYAVGKAVLGACSVGAPHIRQRLYFVAHSTRQRQPFRNGEQSGQLQGKALSKELRPSDAYGLDKPNSGRRTPRQSSTTSDRYRSTAFAASSAGKLAETDSGGQPMRGKQKTQHDREFSGETMRRMGNSDSATSKRHDGEIPGPQAQSRSEWFGHGHQRDGYSGAGYINGFWREADWVLRKRWDRDDWEWCPAQPGAFPLATGASNRVLKLRGYGDCIVAQVAQAFIEASAD